MPAFTLSKSSLLQQRERLRLFQRFLPSLELKRQQLTAEYKKTVQVLEESESGAYEASRSLKALLPLLGGSRMNLSGLVRVLRVDVSDEEVLGLRLPALRSVEFEEAPYSLLATPFWIDEAVECLKEIITYRIRLQVYRERVARMKAAVRHVSQRVNLFEKVLIPTTMRNVAKIRIFLSDLERAAVVTSKISKSRHQKERTVGGERAGGIV